MQPDLSRIPLLKMHSLKTGGQPLYSLQAVVHLDAWSGFQSRQGPYNAVDKNEATDGTVEVMVGEYVSSPEFLSLTDEHVNAYGFTVADQHQVKENILNALMPYYRQVQEDYGLDEDGSSPVTAIEQFKDLVGLSRIHLLDVSKDGYAYVGYEFGCTWDEEHGLGVMTHKDRVIEIDSADIAFNTWTAQEDADPVAAKALLEEYRNTPPVRPAKPWWKFW